jgi:uncharacterized damage-inducible protein DinB
MTEMTLTQTLILQMGYTTFAMHANTENLTDDQAMLRCGEGSNINWVIGHVTASRQHMLNLLGQKPLWTAEAIALYERGTKPPASPVCVAEMINIYRRSGDMIREALPLMSAEAYAEKAPFSPSNNPEETVGSLLAGLLFHESYHIGQLGVLRRSAGLDGAIS